MVKRTPLVFLLKANAYVWGDGYDDITDLEIVESGLPQEIGDLRWWWRRTICSKRERD